MTTDEPWETRIAIVGEPTVPPRTFSNRAAAVEAMVRTIVELQADLLAQSNIPPELAAAAVKALGDAARHIDSQPDELIIEMPPYHFELRRAVPNTDTPRTPSADPS